MESKTQCTVSLSLERYNELIEIEKAKRNCSILRTCYDCNAAYEFITFDPDETIARMNREIKAHELNVRYLISKVSKLKSDLRVSEYSNSLLKKYLGEKIKPKRFFNF